VPDDPWKCLCVFDVDGVDRLVLVSAVDVDEASRYAWHPAGGKRRDQRGVLVGLYAARTARLDGLSQTLYLHRWVAWRAGLLESLTPEPAQRGRWKVSVDHINGDKLDNRRSNLRVANRKQQMSNRNDALPKHNTSGVRGVSFTESRAGSPCPWYASGQVDGKSIGLGTYATMDEAIAARKAWEATGTVPSRGRMREDNTTGVRGVYRQGKGKWFARVVVAGTVIHLGTFSTLDEATAARLTCDVEHAVT
jgi:HNH endonuclease